MLRLSIRHVQRHWRLNLIIFLAVLLGATLAASLPMYSRAAADITVQNTIGDATISQRHLTLSGDINADILNGVDQALGELVQDRREFTMLRKSMRQIIFRPDGTEEETKFSAFFADVWSVDPLQSEIALVEGRWPSDSFINEQDGPITNVIIEVALGSSVATSEDIDLNIGDRIRIEQQNFMFEIVGFVEPRDPESEFWFGDKSLLQFQASRFVDASINVDEMRLGVLMPMPMVKTFITKNSEWRYLVNHDVINAETITDVHSQLLAVQFQEGSTNARVQSGLIEILNQLIAEQNQAQGILYLLLIQSLLAILYTLALLTLFSIEQAQHTLGSLVGRGFNRTQLTGMFALSNGLMFYGLVLPIAPLIAFGAVKIWSLNQPDLPQISLPTESWLFAAGVVTICWLIIVITAYVSTGRNLIAFLQLRARPANSETWWRRLIFELFVLAMGGLAFWQLQGSNNQFSSSSNQTSQWGTDPILLLAPTLILLAIGLLALRLMPFLLRIIARLSQRSNSFLAPAGLLRLARDTTLPTRVVLLITFTVALSLFSIVIRGSVVQRQHEVAHYVTGADMRLKLSLDTATAESEIANITSDPSVRSASHVVRSVATLADTVNNNFINTQVLAVEPNSLPNVAVYPTNFSPFSLDTVLSILEPKEQGILPLVLSSNRQTLHINRGDRYQLIIGRTTIEAEIVGIIETFPGVDQTFVVTNLPLLETLTNLEDPTLDRQPERELWLDVVGGRQDAAVALANGLVTDTILSRILGDALAKANSYQEELIIRQSTAALQINTIVLSILSVVGFLTIQYFGAKQRFSEFGTMQAIGVGRKAWFRLISTEAIAMLILGTILGLILGTALSFMMRPLLVALISSSTGSNQPVDLVFSSANITQLLIVLFLTYSAAIVILNRLLRTIELQKQLRLIQE